MGVRQRGFGLFMHDSIHPIPVPLCSAHSSSTKPNGYGFHTQRWTSTALCRKYTGGHLDISWILLPIHLTNISVNQ